MPGKVPFKVIHISGQDENYRGTDLNTHCPTTKGWQSQRFCSYPQDIVIQLEKKSRIKKIQVLSHQFLIATKIEFFVGDATAMRPDGYASLSNARFTRLGYVALSDNERTGFRARELKSVHVDAIGFYVKLVIHKNHLNKHNQYNQVGLIAINIIGDDWQLPPQIDDLDLHRNAADDMKNKQTSMNLDRPDHISPMDDLAFDMYLDPDVAQVIRKLERKKQEAVAQECYDLAKKIKATIEQLQAVGEKLGKAEVEKRQAIDNEDYDKAKSKKQQMDEYRLLAYEKLRVNDLLDASMMPVILPRPVVDLEPVRLPPSPRGVVDVTGARQAAHAFDIDDLGSSPDKGNISPPHSQRYVAYDDRPLPVMRNKLQSRQHILTPRRRSPVPLTDPVIIRDDRTARTARGDEPPGTPDVSLYEPPPAGVIEAEEMTEKDLRDASPLIDAFDVDLAGKVYSKHWSLREEALIEIRKAMSELDESAGKDEALLLMRGALVAINRSIKDNVFAVFTLALSLHSMILSDFVVVHRVPRSETASFLEKTIPNLLMKTGETSTRHREAAKALIVEESSFPEVKPTNALTHECLRPFKLSTAPRLALSRTEIVDMLYAKHGLHDGGLSLNNVLSFLTHGALRHTAGEVRDKAERLIVTLYEHVGMPVRDYLSNSDEKTRKSLLYKQLFKAFDRTDQTRRGGNVVAEDEVKTSRAVSSPVSHAHDGTREARHRKNSGSKTNRSVAEPTKQTNNSNHQQQNQNAKEAVNKRNNKSRNHAASPSHKKNADNEDSERVCIFCGEADVSFTNDGLDVHYWNSCPVLMRCVHCNQVVEISGLTEHLLEDCDSRADYKQCSRCSEAISLKIYAKHTRDHVCSPAETDKTRCPLCHSNIPSKEESWRGHLMSKEAAIGCPQNPRRTRPQQQQPSKSDRHSAGGKPSRSSPSTVAVKSNSPNAKVQVK